MHAPTIDRNRCRQLLETPYVRVFELAFDDGTRYFSVTRRQGLETLALDVGPSATATLPDAVGCCLVIETATPEPRLVCFREFRYPCGRFLLSIPSGLIDPCDRTCEDPLAAAMARELREECGVTIGDRDTIEVVNPFLFNSPGLTDESCALLAVTLADTSAASLSHAGSEGSERLDDFVLLTRDQAREILAAGHDPWGMPYPMITWAALTHFAYHEWGPCQPRVATGAPLPSCVGEP